MRKTFLRYVAVTTAALTLAACGTDRCATADNPSECRKWADAGGDIDDYLLGGMAGYIIGKQMAGGQSRAYLYRDPSYHGFYRRTRVHIGTRDEQVRRLERKVQSQRLELQRQQAANKRKNVEMKSLNTKTSWSFKASRPRSGAWGSARSRRSSRK